MVTKSQYYAIIALMLIILLLFQFVENSLDIFFDFDYNPNAESLALTEKTKLDFENAKGSMVSLFGSADKHIAVVSDTKANGKTSIPAVTDMCRYLRFNYRIYSSLTAVPNDNIALLVVGKKVTNARTDVPILQKFNESKVPIIFAVAPDATLVQNNSALRNIMGVLRVIEEQKQLDGITLFEGFLLGGKAIYDEMEDISVPYFMLNAGVKIYSAGILNTQKEEGITNENLPPLVWRYRYNDTYVFTCNHDFLTHSSGIGFFIGMLSEMSENFIYPVINAQTLLMLEFPTIAPENKNELKKLYNQEYDEFLRVSVWPTFTSIMNETNNKPTYFYATAFNEKNCRMIGEESANEFLSFYLKQTRRQYGEMGISGFCLLDGGKSDRLLYDMDFISRILPKYIFTVFSPSGLSKELYLPLLEKGGLLENVKTVIAPLEEDGDITSFEYILDDVMSLPITQNGFYHTNEDNIALRSIQTALAASNIAVSGYQICYPRGEEDNWLILGRDFARYTYSYWYPFRAFEKVVASDADLRVRSYFSTTYETIVNGDSVYIYTTWSDEPLYFILKTDKRNIVSIENASYTVIEDYVYLIEVTAREAQIKLTKAEDIGFDYE